MCCGHYLFTGYFRQVLYEGISMQERAGGQILQGPKELLAFLARLLQQAPDPLPASSLVTCDRKFHWVGSCPSPPPFLVTTCRKRSLLPGPMRVLSFYPRSSRHLARLSRCGEPPKAVTVSAVFIPEPQIILPN